MILHILLSMTLTSKVSYLDQLRSSKFQKGFIGLCSTCTSHHRLSRPRCSISGDKLPTSEIAPCVSLATLQLQRVPKSALEIRQLQNQNMRERIKANNYQLKIFRRKNLTLYCLQKDKLAISLLFSSSKISSKYLFLKATNVIIILLRLFIYLHCLYSRVISQRQRV